MAALVTDAYTIMSFIGFGVIMFYIHDYRERGREIVALNREVARLERDLEDCDS